MSTTNPKLQTKHAKSLFKYYAGFSDDFVISAIQKEQEQLNQDALIVLDPWNGSGTTTHACNQLGVKSIGVDRNPAMAVFAQARAACNSSIEQILTTPALPSNVRSDDPLLTWFMPSSAKHIRGIEEGIKSISTPEGRALGYIVLFNTTKNLLKKYHTSNPTWIKKPELKNRIRPSAQQIQLEFNSIRSSLASHKFPEHNSSSKSVIVTGDSCKLPLADSSINLTITSPPYCTRIDYAIATSIELSVLSCSQHKFSELREALMGATTVVDGITSNSAWGKTCLDTLDSIRKHPSKASSGYYTKNFIRYFDSLFRSICEITRVTKAQGRCHMVIQDSYYKEIHIDLPIIASEMFIFNGWSLDCKTDFISTRNKATINSKSKKYKANKKATESVITLRKDK